MLDFLADARDVLVPGKSGKHGPLPPLLVSMTLVTGLVDAFSYLTLGHVFVANMTGNVVFIGFALAGAPGSRSRRPWSRWRRFWSAPDSGAAQRPASRRPGAPA